MAKFVFPSAWVEKNDAAKTLKVRFFARETDQLILTVEGVQESKPFGAGAMIKIKVDAPRGTQSCPTLDELESDYTPGIELTFTGAYTAQVVPVCGEDGFEVVSEGVISVVEDTGLPWTEEELRKATQIDIGGARGNWSPHYPRKPTPAGSAA